MFDYAKTILSGKNIKKWGCILAGVIFLSCMTWHSINCYYNEKIIKHMETDGVFLKKEENVEDINEIRNWAFEHIVWSATGSIDNFSTIFYRIMPPNMAIFQCFDSPEGTEGVYCDGAAYALASLYEILGYNACFVDFVVYDENQRIINSHVTTMIEFGNEWIVQDSTFNITYMEAGEFLLLREIRDYVANNEAQNIDVVQGNEKYRKVILKDKNSEILYPIKNLQLIQKKYVADTNMSIETMNVFYENNLYSQFAKDGYEEKPTSIYMYPYAIRQPFFSTEKETERELKEILDLK